MYGNQTFFIKIDPNRVEDATRNERLKIVSPLNVSDFRRTKNQVDRLSIVDVHVTRHDNSFQVIRQLSL